MRRIAVRGVEVGRTADLVRLPAGENAYHDADQCCDAHHLPWIVAYVDIGVLADLTRLGTNLRRTVGQSALGRCKRDFDFRLDTRDFRRLHIPQRMSQILDVLDEAVDLAVGEFLCSADVAVIYRGFHWKFLLCHWNESPADVFAPIHPWLAAG